MNTVNGEDIQTDGGLWIQTFTGTHFYPLKATPEMVFIEDIAHALSNICRFAGHIKEFYSVAQHSAYVAALTEGDAKEKLRGLLHDAAEAYIVDVPRPIKASDEMQGYRKIEGNLLAVIGKRFDLGQIITPAVKAADNRLFMNEATTLMPGGAHWTIGVEPFPDITIRPVSPEAAENVFLSTFVTLARQVSEETE